MSSYKILDLFAGAGGFSLGFELVYDENGYQVFELHRAVEINKWACETLRTKYGKDKVIEGDLTKKEVHRKVIADCADKIDIIIGGIPCQSFSLLGPRSGYGRKNKEYIEDERDHLYMEYKAIVAEIRPKIIVIENVKGILSKKDKDGKSIINQIILDFEELGYYFENDARDKYFLLNAADFGVPQRRERVIFIGILKSWKSMKVPMIKPTHFNPDKSDQFEYGLLPNVNLREAIGDLPRIKPKITLTGLKEWEKKIVKRENTKINNGTESMPFYEERYQKRISKMSPEGQNYHRFIRPNGYAYLNYHVARPQQKSDLKLFKKMNQGERALDYIVRNPKQAAKLIKYNMEGFQDKYRKQIWQEPSSTIFAHLKKDGNRFIHPLQIRTFTVREAARLQSFPDEYIFEGPMGWKFWQIGNAVPPLMAKNIAMIIDKVLKC
jgi:DNA (cytosine-5)-methyltransferase 1